MKRPAWTRQEMSVLQAVMWGGCGVLILAAGLIAQYVYHNQAGAIWFGGAAALTLLVPAVGMWHLAGSQPHKDAQALKNLILDKLAGHLDAVWVTPSGAGLEVSRFRFGGLFIGVSVLRMPAGGWDPRPGTDYGMTFAVRYQVTPATPGVTGRQIPYRIHRGPRSTTRERITDPTTKITFWNTPKILRAEQTGHTEVQNLIREVGAAYTPPASDRYRDLP